MNCKKRNTNKVEVAELMADTRLSIRKNLEPACQKAAVVIVDVPKKFTESVCHKSIRAITAFMVEKEDEADPA